jgi:hypothetical protein
MGTGLVPRSLLAELHSRAIYLHYLRCLLCAVLLLSERRAHVLVIARVYVCIALLYMRARAASERIWECVGVFGSRVHQAKECVGDRWLFSRTLSASMHRSPQASIKTAPERTNREKLFNCRFFLINPAVLLNSPHLLAQIVPIKHYLERTFSCSGKSEWQINSCACFNLRLSLWI